MNAERKDNASIKMTVTAAEIYEDPLYFADAPAVNKIYREGIYDMGMEYVREKGNKEINMREAFECFLNAGKRGHRKSQSWLVTCYGWGLGCEQDMDRADHWKEIIEKRG